MHMGRSFGQTALAASFRGPTLKECTCLQLVTCDLLTESGVCPRNWWKFLVWTPVPQVLLSTIEGCHFGTYPASGLALGGEEFGCWSLPNDEHDFYTWDVVYFWSIQLSRPYRYLMSLKVPSVWLSLVRLKKEEKGSDYVRYVKMLLKWCGYTYMCIPVK